MIRVPPNPALGEHIVPPRQRAYGLADRAHKVPSTLSTRFAIASGTKAFTALVIVNLLAEGVLSP